MLIDSVFKIHTCQNLPILQERIRFLFPLVYGSIREFRGGAKMIFSHTRIKSQHSIVMDLLNTGRD